jgi:geranylgeranyl diphosphate synthase type II
MSVTQAKARSIRAVVPRPTPHEQIKQALEKRLMELLPNNDDPDDLLNAAMHHAVLGAGKRVRPMLFISISRDLGCDMPALLDLACAIEIVHAASLILDDLPCMDNAKLRRGQPAVHVQFGEDVALLAAVALLSHAFHIVASANGVSSCVKMRLTAVLAHVVGAQGLAKGQYRDLHHEQKGPVADIAATYSLKTGALLRVVVEMITIVGQTSAETTKSLLQFASTVGQAFQIRDDLLDAGVEAVLAKGEVIGKDLGQDTGKATLPAALGIDVAGLEMASEVMQANRHLELALGPGNLTRLMLAALFPSCAAPHT